MSYDLPVELLDRLKAAGLALPTTDSMRDIADEVAAWDAEGLIEAQINKRIDAWAKANGYDFDSWLAELEEEQPGIFDVIPGLDPRKIWDAMGVRDWVRECIRSLAFTEEPSPFLPFAAGFWIRLPDADPPALLAYITPLSDPQLAARQLQEYHREMFGLLASRSTKAAEVDNARMLMRHRQGLSYRQIALQNLRDRYPDIVDRQKKYRIELDRERERVVKCVAAAERLWKERLPESSTAD